MTASQAFSLTTTSPGSTELSGQAGIGREVQRLQDKVLWRGEAKFNLHHRGKVKSLETFLPMVPEYIFTWNLEEARSWPDEVGSEVDRNIWNVSLNVLFLCRFRISLRPTCPYPLIELCFTHVYCAPQSRFQ